MKVRWLIFAVGLMIPGVLSADSVTCGFSLTSLSSAGCVTLNSFSFTDSMLWTSAGSAWQGPGEPNPEPVDGMANDPANSAVYTGTSSFGVSVNATTASGGSGTLLGRYDEAPWVWAGNTIGWTQPGVSNCTAYSYVGGNGVCTSSSSTPYLLTVQAGFDFSTSTDVVYGPGSVDANTALLGTTNGTGPIQLSFSKSLTSFGVDIDALNATNFTATLMAYDGNTLLGTYYVNANGIGGICQSLDLSPTNGGVGCNNAPFIGISNLGPITKIVLGVTDNSSGNPTDFAIDGLELGGESVITPEPGQMLLMACGLGGLVWWRRKSSANVR